MSGFQKHENAVGNGGDKSVDLEIQRSEMMRRAYPNETAPMRREKRNDDDDGDIDDENDGNCHKFDVLAGHPLMVGDETVYVPDCSALIVGADSELSENNPLLVAALKAPTVTALFNIRGFGSHSADEKKRKSAMTKKHTTKIYKKMKRALFQNGLGASLQMEGEEILDRYLVEKARAANKNPMLDDDKFQNALRKSLNRASRHGGVVQRSDGNAGGSFPSLFKPGRGADTFPPVDPVSGYDEETESKFAAAKSAAQNGYGGGDIHHMSEDALAFAGESETLMQFTSELGRNGSVGIYIKKIPKSKRYSFLLSPTSSDPNATTTNGEKINVIPPKKTISSLKFKYYLICTCDAGYEASGAYEALIRAKYEQKTTLEQFVNSQHYRLYLKQCYENAKRLTHKFASMLELSVYIETNPNHRGVPQGRYVNPSLGRTFYESEKGFDRALAERARKETCGDCVCPPFLDPEGARSLSCGCPCNCKCRCKEGSVDNNNTIAENEEPYEFAGGLMKNKNEGDEKLVGGKEEKFVGTVTNKQEAEKAKKFVNMFFAAKEPTTSTSIMSNRKGNDMFDTTMNVGAKTEPNASRKTDDNDDGNMLRSEKKVTTLTEPDQSLLGPKNKKDPRSWRAYRVELPVNVGVPLMAEPKYFHFDGNVVNIKVPYYPAKLVTPEERRSSTAPLDLMYTNVYMIKNGVMSVRETKFRKILICVNALQGFCWIKLDDEVFKDISAPTKHIIPRKTARHNIATPKVEGGGGGGDREVAKNIASCVIVDSLDTRDLIPVKVGYEGSRRYWNKLLQSEREKYLSDPKSFVSEQKKKHRKHFEKYDRKLKPFEESKSNDDSDPDSFYSSSSSSSNSSLSREDEFSATLPFPSSSSSSYSSNEEEEEKGHRAKPGSLNEAMKNFVSSNKGNGYNTFADTTGNDESLPFVVGTEPASHKKQTKRYLKSVRVLSNLPYDVQVKSNRFREKSKKEGLNPVHFHPKESLLVDVPTTMASLNERLSKRIYGDGGKGRETFSYETLVPVCFLRSHPEYSPSSTL